MKIINNKNTYFSLLIYLIGIFHWIFFFYFVDYYEYNNENILDEINIINEKSNIIHQDSVGSYSFSIPINIGKIANKYLDTDKSLIKSFIKNPKLNNLFQNKIFFYSDWENEHKVYDVIKYSLDNQIIPYHSPYGVGNHPKLNRFLANPMISISPQIFLLKFFNTQTFFFINFIIMFTIGYIGCLFFKKKFNLGYLSFIFLFLIYNFNGYFVEKVSAYGPHLMGYFIIPFFLYFIFIASDSKNILKKNQINIGVLIGISNALILLQGSIHLYTISVTFLILWAIVNFRLYLLSFISFITNFSLSSIKILPAFIAYGNQENQRYWEAGGYANLSSFFESFVVLKNHFNFLEFYSHELSLFISFFGMILLVYFALIYPSMKEQKNNINYWITFGIPIVILIFISFRHFKSLIIPQWIPLLNSESVTSRYMIIPLLIVLFIATINLQDFIDKGFKNLRVKITIYSLISLMFLSLINHSRSWRMHIIENQNLWYKKLLSINPQKISSTMIQNNYSDSIYIYSFWIGFTITLITIILLVFWFILIKYISNKTY